MIFRLYWLGPASEPGIWGLDTGIKTPIWRIHTWELRGIVRPDVLPLNAPPETPRPRGWITINIDHGVRIAAPEGEFERAPGPRDRLPAYDPIATAYRKYAVPTF